MAKIDPLKTIDDGWYEESDLNYNFKKIEEAFQNTVSLDASTPNHFETDLDVADATITNVREVNVSVLNVEGTDIASYSGLLAWQLEDLNWVKGVLVYAPKNAAEATDDGLDTLLIGNTGEHLVTAASLPTWQVKTLFADGNLTVKQDGVIIDNNVSRIDFIWGGEVMVTNPVEGEAELDLTLMIGPLFEDTNQLDTNLDPSADPLFNDPTETVRLDLVASTRLTSEPTVDGAYYVVVEASNYFESAGYLDAAGTWHLGVQFYQNDGTATPQTGTEITPTDVSTNSTSDPGGNLITLFCKIPPGTRYIDFFWSLLPVAPFSLSYTSFSDRYRAVISAAEYGTFQTPNGQTASASNPSTSPRP